MLSKKLCKYLGVYLDEQLSWGDQIRSINLKLSKSLGIISKIRHYVPQYLIKMIYYSFFQSHINYGIENWAGAHDSTLDSLRASNNKAVQLMTFSDYRTTAQPLFDNLKLLNFDQTIKLNDDHSHRLISHTERYVPIARTQYKARFVSSRGLLFWESISKEIRALIINIFTYTIPIYGIIFNLLAIFTKYIYLFTKIYICFILSIYFLS